jgi:hypothetical protein
MTIEQSGRAGEKGPSAMSCVTLQAAKDQLRVTFDDDDGLIQAKIDAVEMMVSQYIDAPLDDKTVFPNGLEAPVKEAILQLVAHFYDNREPLVIGANITVAVQAVPSAFDLLRPYRSWGGFGSPSPSRRNSSCN